MTRSIARAAAALAVLLLAAPSARAGDVTAALKRGTLVLQGDDLGASLVLSPPIPLARGGNGSSVMVTPQGETTLNGSANAAVFTPVESLKITLGDGSNAVTLQELSLGGRVSFKGGAGDDDFVVQDTSLGDDAAVAMGDGSGTVVLFAGSTINGNLKLTAGAGLDTVMLEGSVGGSAKLSLGSGTNTLSGGGAIGESLSYKGGVEADTLTLSGFQVGQDLKAKLSNGDNTITLDTSSQIGESLKVKGGSGADTVTTNAAQIGADANLNLAAGNNTASLTDTLIGDDLVVKAKGGDDTVALLGTTAVGDQTNIDVDGGANVVP